MFKKSIYALLALGIMTIIAMTIGMCQRTSTPDDKVTVSKAVLTKLIEDASNVKVERHDSIIYKDKIVIRDHNLPVPVLVVDSVRLYTDHIKNSDIDITILDSVRGTLLKRSFNFIPIIKTERIEITKEIPTLITADCPSPVPKTQLQIALIGTYKGSYSALMGAEIGIINKKNYGLHYQYQTNFTNQKFHSIKFSKNFNF